MEFERCIQPAFRVIGMEGSTEDGEGFVARLWAAANARFQEVAPLARMDENGSPVVWGAMSDLSRSFLPWEDGFSRGLYLAGVEVVPGAEAPEGWTAWDIPGFECLRFRADGAPDMFNRALDALREAGFELVCAAQECTHPGSGEEFLCFPIRRL